MKTVCNKCKHFQLFLIVLPVSLIDIDYPSLVLFILCQHVSATHLKIFYLPNSFAIEHSVKRHYSESKAFKGDSLCQKLQVL